jgi:hypothetical protein
MGMSKWECGHHGCDVTAVGSGGAVGLRAIGWWFEPGPHLFCPAHRPDPSPCHQEYNAGNEGKSCPFCTAEAEAHGHQEAIRERLGMPPGPRPLLT